MKYELLGIDVDGTLLNPQGLVSHVNRQAIKTLQTAGVHVVPCTGRSCREAQAVLQDVPGLIQGVFVTGASVSDMINGTCLNTAEIEPPLVAELIDFLDDTASTILCFREASRAGHDYLIAGQGPIDPSLQTWFEITGATVHVTRHVTPQEMHHVLRLSLAVRSNTIPAITQNIQQRFGHRVLVHACPALNMPNLSSPLYIVEIFARGVDKWRGLSWVATQRQVPSDRIAVIGDQINDLAMIRSAGCGIAMGNAVDSVQQIADRQTHSNAQDGVAYAIEQILNEKW